NLEVVKCADWVVDLGPEAGDDGGEIVGAGTPEQIAKIENSHTGRFLRNVFSKSQKDRAVIPNEGEGPHSARLITQRDLRNPSPNGRSFAYAKDDSPELARAAETAPRFRVNRANGAIGIHGAREHNLKNI